MIKVAVRSISIVVSGILFLSTLAAGEPFSVVDSFRQNIKMVESLSASIERIQLYRNTERKSAGTVKYEKKYGAVYDWESPGMYRFFRSDFGAYGVDLKKKQGWKTEFGTPDPEFSRQIDPLYRLMHLASLSSTQLTYRGNSGDLLVFSMNAGGGKKKYICFDAVSYRCRLIENVDGNGYVSEKTKLYYPSNDAKTPVPQSIVVTSLAGSELSIDSVIIKKAVINRKIGQGQFAIPAQVTWHKRISAVLTE